MGLPNLALLPERSRLTSRLSPLLRGGRCIAKLSLLHLYGNQLTESAKSDIARAAEARRQALAVDLG